MIAVGVGCNRAQPVLHRCVPSAVQYAFGYCTLRFALLLRRSQRGPEFAGAQSMETMRAPDVSLPREMTVDEVREALRENEALILFAAGPSSTFYWAITKNEARWGRASVASTIIADQVAALRCGLYASAWDARRAPR